MNACFGNYRIILERRSYVGAAHGFDAAGFSHVQLQAVYHMPTAEEEMPASSIPLALQSTFYKVSLSTT